MPAPVMTTIFLQRPDLMYSATASIVLPARVLGGVDSSMGELSSLPILKKRPMEPLFLFLPLPLPPFWLR